MSTLLLAGTSTSGCVRATAVDACSLDYAVLVVSECVEDRATLSGEVALFDMDAKRRRRRRTPTRLWSCVARRRVAARSAGEGKEPAWK